MDATVKQACKKVFLIFAIAMAFCLVIFTTMGQQSALEFLGAYLIEFSLSIDNLFVFMTVFAAFQIPVVYQHRILAWGIATAVVLRFIFILLGVTVVQHFSWILPVFGIILVFSGINMFRTHTSTADTSNNVVLRLLKRAMPFTDAFIGNRFFAKIQGRWHGTPLLAALLVIECSDIVFAIDSVPAAFSVSTNLFLVYTSNILAILGLRQLYFVLEHLQERFQYVRYGVAIILCFTGVKLLALMANIHISIPLSIGLILAVLTGSIIFSILATKEEQQQQNTAVLPPIRKK